MIDISLSRARKITYQKPSSSSLDLKTFDPHSSSSLIDAVLNKRAKAACANHPLYIPIVGVPGVGKSTFLASFLPRLNSETGQRFELIGFGDEMFKTLRGRGGSHQRDDFRKAPLPLQKEIIEATLARVMAENRDPSTIYLIDCHPLVETPEGYLLGVTPLQSPDEFFLHYGGALQLVGSPTSIKVRAKADLKRTRTHNPSKIEVHQKTIGFLHRLTRGLTGTSHPEIFLPIFEDPSSKKAQGKMVLQGRKALAEILSHQASPEVLDSLLAELGQNDSFQRLNRLRESGKLFELLPLFRLLTPEVLDHTFSVVWTLQKIILRDYREFYDNVAEKDSTYEEYRKNMEFFSRFYEGLNGNERKNLWLLALLHDIGKAVQWGWRHIYFGRIFSYNLFRAFGIADSEAKILSTIVHLHGALGEVILGEEHPDRILDELNNYPLSLRTKILGFIAMINFCDFMGWRQARAGRNEYLVEFRKLFNFSYLKSLRKQWLVERLKRYSRKAGLAFAAPFDPDLYEEMLRAYQEEIPEDERVYFDHHHSKTIHGTNQVTLMLNLSPRNKIRYLHLQALIAEAFMRKGLIPRERISIMHEQPWPVKEMDLNAMFEKLLGSLWPLRLAEVERMLEASNYQEILGFSLYIEDECLFMNLQET